MKKYFRIVTKGTPTMSFMVENVTNQALINFVTNIMTDGHVVTENFFLKYDEIKFITCVEFNDGATVQPFKPTLVS